MCGICGELRFGPGGEVHEPELIAMRDQLVHRGPDSDGVYVSPNRRVGLGFRRLRIIDLTANASQPLSNEDGTVQIVFNGEIYNFQELRKGLVARGHRFKSNSDTEVIVHLYEEKGADCIADLDGMFALAIWDDRQRRLLLARDRAGEKRLAAAWGAVEQETAGQAATVERPQFGVAHRSQKGKLEAAAKKGKGKPLSKVKLRPPLPKPENIICMAVNYMEDGTLPEPAPINAFMKSPSSIIGDGDTMVLPDVPAGIFEGEAELALVIGKRAHNVKAADYKQYIFGYTCFIDGSARGLPPPGIVFFQMKSRATFAPMGPWLVTADEIPDPQKLAIELKNNGVSMQKFNTDDMAHQIPRCIEWLSSIHTLEPGDVVATGTNHRGLNSFMDGDKIELTIEKVGTLKFNVKDELKRTWARTTRSQHKDAGKEGAHTPQLTGKYAK